MKTKVEIINEIENLYIEEFPKYVQITLDENEDLTINDLDFNEIIMECDFTYSRIGMLIELRAISSDDDVVQTANVLMEEGNFASIHDPKRYIKKIIEIERKALPDSSLKVYLDGVEDDRFLKKVDKALYGFKRDLEGRAP